MQLEIKQSIETTKSQVQHRVSKTGKPILDISDIVEINSYTSFQEYIQTYINRNKRLSLKYTTILTQAGKSTLSFKETGVLGWHPRTDSLQRFLEAQDILPVTQADFAHNKFTAEGVWVLLHYCAFADRRSSPDALKRSMARCRHLISFISLEQVKAAFRGNKRLSNLLPNKPQFPSMTEQSSTCDRKLEVVAPITYTINYGKIAEALNIINFWADRDDVSPDIIGECIFLKATGKSGLKFQYSDDEITAIKEITADYDYYRTEENRTHKSAASIIRTALIRTAF